MRSDQKPVNALVTACVLVSIAIAASADTWYVDAGAIPGGDGTSWATAFDTIQDGINAASTGDEVLCHDGTYTGNGNRDISFNGKAVTVQSLNGPENCIIDCQTVSGEAHRGFRFTGNETSSSILDGFTITNGQAPIETNSFTGELSQGGAIYLNNANPQISNCLFVFNMTWPVFGTGLPDNFGFGGAIACISSSPEIWNCEFVNNKAYMAGAIYIVDSNPVISKCTFLENKAGKVTAGTLLSYGGAILCDENSILNLSQCKFLDNAAYNLSVSGDSIFSKSNTQINLANCEFVFERTGTIMSYGTLRVKNCTIFQNWNTNWDGPFMIIIDGDLHLHNSILWGDPLRTGHPIGLTDSTATITYSNIQHGWDGVGNIDAQPCFVQLPDLASNDYGDLHTLPSSPGNDAGNNALFPANMTEDLGGQTRYCDDPFTEDSGSVLFPIIDMGAYEYHPNPGDVDADEDVDLTDYAGFQTCIGAEDDFCRALFDLDADLDIDLDDFLLFEGLITGPR